MLDDLRIAVAHEWVAARAGSEKTFEALAEAFPSADLHALTVEPGVELHVGERPVSTSFLDRPWLRSRRALTLPLMPAAWRAARGGPYDLVVSSSHAAVKGFAPGREALHLCYCHTPMRYAWLPELERRALLRAAGPARAGLRRWDRRSARWVDDFAANSSVVADRIRDFYGRPARVIAPPVDVDFFAEAELLPRSSRSGLVALSRWIGYKRIDLAILAAGHVGLPLTVVGSGPDGASLRRLAERSGANVTFVESPDDHRVRHLLQHAQAVVFPPEEDFGLVPVEAQAAGTPVVAYGRGGARDTVVDGVTGVLTDRQDVEAFADGVRRVIAADIEPEACRANARRFARARFVTDVRGWAESACRGAGLLR